MQLKKNPVQRMENGRDTLVLDHPFFGHLACKLDIVYDRRTNTLATDGEKLYVSSKYLETVDDEELLFLWAHEVMHPAHHHHTRRGDRDPKLWNEAGDYEINLLLAEAKVGKMPAGGLLDWRFKGQSIDQIYAILEAERNRQPPQSGGDTQEKESTGDRLGDSDSEDLEERGAGDAGSDVLEGEASAEDGPSDPRDGTRSSAGSAAAGGGAGDGGRDHPLANVPGAVFDAPEPSQSESEWTVAVQQAEKAATMMGNMPGNVRAHVDEAIRPRTDWRSIMQRFVQELAASDYSWCRPDRTFIQQGLYLPALQEPCLGRVVIAIDSSESTLDYLPAFKGHLQAIVEEAQPSEVTVIMADADVKSIETFARGEPVEFNVSGLGGTDFRPTFARVEQEQLAPACLIYLTDGYGTFPETPPDYPVLWAMAATPHMEPVIAPWGETVRIDQP